MAGAWIASPEQAGFAPAAPGEGHAHMAMADTHIGSMTRLRGPCGFGQQELLVGGGGVGNAPVRLE